MNILLIENDENSKLALVNLLSIEGHRVFISDNYIDGFHLVKSEDISFVIACWDGKTDDGRKFCESLRGIPGSRYIYIILTTEHDSDNDPLSGLSFGADDILLKPYDIKELTLRIKAGTRIISLEKKLEKKNRTLEAYNRRMENDLNLAAELQQSLLPEKNLIAGKCSFESLFVPCQFVAGDIYDYYSLDDSHAGFYLLDVSGHGVPAAMLSFTLSKFLSVSEFSGRSIHTRSEGKKQQLRKPSEILLELNNLFQMGLNTCQYFTMILGYVNTRTFEVVMSIAGHPPPIIVSAAGKSRLAKGGGFPVGFFRDIGYEDYSFSLNPGDRLYIYSDGITEICDIREGDNSNIVMDFLLSQRDQSISDVMKNFREIIRSWNKKPELDDDFSMMVIEAGDGKDQGAG